MQNLNPAYIKDNVRKNIMYWWLGQVVDEEHWIGNEAVNLTQRDSDPGWGKRYRVRIFSRDSEVKLVPDSQLDMAEVIVPVTSGSGHQGYGETPSLAQGSFVMGFYLDGEEGRQPIIIGALPNHPQTRLFADDPQTGFVARSGFHGITGNKKIATHDLNERPGSDPSKQDCSSTGSTKTTVCHYDQLKDGKEVGVRKKNIECEGGSGPVKGIQGFIQRALAVIKRIKDEANSFLGAASNLTNSIRNIVDSTATFVSSMFKLIVGKMRGYVLSKINNGIKDVANLLPPNLRQAAEKGITTGNDTLGCVFQRIIGGLYNLARNLLNDIIENFISAPMCAAEKIVGDMIGSILGDITDAIDGALGIIDGLIDAAGNIIDQVFDVLDFIAGLLNFLKCDETPNCDYKDRWSFWDGSSIASDVSANLNRAIGDIAKGIAVDTADCNTSQIPCGPPSVQFNGGGGSGIFANPIISLGGQIMGLDFSDFGSGYTSTPSISLSDPCGNGGGANLTVLSTYVDGTPSDAFPKSIIGSGSSTTEISITGAVVNDPGSGYLPVPDGSTNASTSDQTIVVDSEGNTNTYSPGQTVQLPVIPYEDDNAPTIFLPQNTQVDLFNPENGEVLQTIDGVGQLNGVVAPNGGTFTVPTPDIISNPISDPRPIVNGESVDVVLDGVYIEDPGVNYEIGDQIIIAPDNGVTMYPVFNDVGSLVDVVITNPGDIFNEWPRIYIKSTTGVNANILPIFRVRRPEEDPDQRLKDLLGERIITVDDCVGRLVIGYVDGRPYYGSYYLENGRKIVGEKRSNKKKIYIYDTPEESLRMSL